MFCNIFVYILKVGIVLFCFKVFNMVLVMLFILFCNGRKFVGIIFRFMLVVRKLVIFCLIWLVIGFGVVNEWVWLGVFIFIMLMIFFGFICI